MRTFILTTLAASALALPAMAQINAPSPGELHPSGSLLWPRDDSFAYLRGQGIDKNLANEAVENAAPQGRRVTVDSLQGTAPFLLTPAPEARVPYSTEVSARVPSFTPSSDWGVWRQHQYDCAIAYPTYSPMTDMVMRADGGREFCQLSLASSGIRF